MPRKAQRHGFVPPMQCQDVEKLPEGPEWIYEVKLDGYRAQAIAHDGKLELLSRNGLDLGHRFPALVEALRHAIPEDSVVDGELVALDPEGRPSFSLREDKAAKDVVKEQPRPEKKPPQSVPRKTAQKTTRGGRQ